MIPPLSEALAERGYETLTAVQEAVSDPELVSEDLLVSAQTGSGKTVGFGLAIAPGLLGEAHEFGPAATPMALIIAPTRELAMQVMHELRWLYAKTGAQITACVGGMDMRQERRALERGTHIVVGTPGRLSDHIRRGALDLGDIRAVVLDEADEMLDLGFREDLEFILGEAPDDRRTLLFSATVSPMIAKLAAEVQRDAKRINLVTKAEQHSDISYQAIRVAHDDGDNAIFNLLRYNEGESAIVFANTRAAVNNLAARLGNRGIPVVTLSGELSQAERSQALQAMRDGRARVCVATDVAARGIDLPGLTLVIHADLPTNTESLLHRSGRTGRAGRKGTSALIVGPRAVKKAERLLKWAKIDAEWTLPPSAQEIMERDEHNLMEDPAWAEEVAEETAALAARLLERHGAEAVAAGFLRLRQARHAPPEDLLPPDTSPAKAPRDFGPAQWYSLSVGRATRAEPRWLLPMILRATDLDKAVIGAIRIREDETFLEVAEGSAPQFDAALGEGGELSDGVIARKLDSAPDLGPSGPRRPRPGGDRHGERGDRRDGPRPGGDRGGDRGGYKGKREDRGDFQRGPKPAWKERAESPRIDDPEVKAPYKPRKEAGPRKDSGAPKSAGRVWKDRDGGEGKPAYKKPGGFKKEGGFNKDGDSRKPGGFKKEGGFRKDGPRGEGGGKDGFKKPGFKKDGGKSFGEGKPAPRRGGPTKDGSYQGAGFQRPDGKKPFGKPAGKPTGKPGGKPGGKPRAGKPRMTADSPPRRKPRS
ncbi:DEAD/DEAH box helicase [Oceanicola sp. S124]|uniref:DEAD/DEAH box helicase n=1 Tax=Oceanicola sp. S124 TaxID=1042378 RepID=UPI00058EEACD|nr:DEAD/DEAH box helicase [Oceanicola sp. S124]